MPRSRKTISKSWEHRQHPLQPPPLPVATSLQEMAPPLTCPIKETTPDLSILSFRLSPSVTRPPSCPLRTSFPFFLPHPVQIPCSTLHSPANRLNFLCPFWKLLFFLSAQGHILAAAEKSNSQGDCCYSSSSSSSTALDATLQACPASLLRASSQDTS